jgi:hypothetical protein
MLKILNCVLVMCIYVYRPKKLFKPTRMIQIGKWKPIATFQTVFGFLIRFGRLYYATCIFHDMQTPRHAMYYTHITYYTI